MKKIYFLLPFFALASCATVDEDTSQIDNPVLVTKMVQDGDNFTFSYNGTKITEMNNTTDAWKRNFIYTGDLITKYVNTYSDGTTDTTVLTYNSNQKITKKTTTASSMTTTVSYVYIGGDQIQITSALTAPGYSKTYTKMAYTNSTGSLKNWTETVSEVGTGGTVNGTGSLQTVIYDGGNFPFKNITGYVKMLESEDMNGSERNVLNYKHLITYPTTAGEEATIFTSTYEYNTNGYPKKGIRDYYHGNGSGLSSEITTYEYNHL